MSVWLETSIKRYLADTPADELPRVGRMYDGAVLTAQSLPVGSTVLIRSTGQRMIWNGSDWATPEPVEALEQEDLLSRVVDELRQIRLLLEITTADN